MKNKSSKNSVTSTKRPEKGQTTLVEIHVPRPIYKWLMALTADAEKLLPPEAPLSLFVAREAYKSIRQQIKHAYENPGSAKTSAT